MKECILYKKEKNKVRCLACSHKCLISEGKTGICGVRKNINEKLYLLVYGKPCAVHVDPIEKKPLYHFLPGTRTFSIGSFGCNLRCGWCQNYEISQKTKGKDKEEVEDEGYDLSPKQVVEQAIKTECKSISYTYNEPAIFSEYVYDCAEIAHKKGLKNVLVTNGYFSKESFDFLMIEKLIDAVNIDLKSFSDATYKKYCGARLKPVLDNIKMFYDAVVHIEITTLIIPGVNDSEKELEKIAEFIAKIDKNIPWHISRFFPNYKMLDKSITGLGILEKAREIGIKAGLKFVHIGNV
jgi:pyruvate formate lyase activating enzyme